MGSDALAIMDDGAKRWLWKTARQQYWRVASWIELDDLVSDGYLHYYRVLRKYPQVTDRPHIMRLFQITYINHIHNLAKQRTRQVDRSMADTLVMREGDEETRLADQSLSEDSLGPLWAALVAAPQLLQELLKAMGRVDSGPVMRAAYRVKKDGTRETVNERLCRMVGVRPESVDLASMLRSYLFSLR
jgi:hypothetical protein